jgi:recombinational DNA repair ATPase RecF
MMCIVGLSRNISTARGHIHVYFFKIIGDLPFIKEERKNYSLIITKTMSDKPRQQPYNKRLDLQAQRSTKRGTTSNGIGRADFSPKSP